MVKNISVFGVSLIFLVTYAACATNELENSSICKPSLSVMYRLCKIRRPAPTNRTADCIQWFHAAVGHCAGILQVDSHRLPILDRMTKWVMPSFKTLLNFERITDYKPATLTESDCKILLSKLSRDFIIRGPHYKLLNNTAQYVWALLCLAMSILMLVAASLGVHRFYIEFLKPKLDEREIILKYFEGCATEPGAARHRTLVAVNQLMQSALFEANHLHFLKIPNLQKDAI